MNNITIDAGNGEYQSNPENDVEMVEYQDSGTAQKPGLSDERKLFVGGLSWETSEADVKEYFGQFGAIDSVKLKTDPNTGRSRGFAFIVFSTPESLNKATSFGTHVIKNKKVDAKKFKAKPVKIFVGGLVPTQTDDDIKNFFEAYGKIIQIETPFDKIRNQRKGFCFITYESEQIVQDLLKTPKVCIKGKYVDLRRAIQPDANSMGMNGMPSMMGQNLNVAALRGGAMIRTTGVQGVKCEHCGCRCGGVTAGAFVNPANNYGNYGAGRGVMQGVPTQIPMNGARGGMQRGRQMQRHQPY